MAARSDGAGHRRVRGAARDLLALAWTVALLAFLFVPGSAGFVLDLPVPVLAALAVVALFGARRVVVKSIAYGRIITRARRNRLDLAGNLVRRPALGIADLTYEVAALVSSSVDHRLKYLASARVSSRIGCPF